MYSSFLLIDVFAGVHKFVKIDDSDHKSSSYTILCANKDLSLSSRFFTKITSHKVKNTNEADNW